MSSVPGGKRGRGRRRNRGNRGRGSQQSQRESEFTQRSTEQQSHEDNNEARAQNVVPLTEEHGPNPTLASVSQTKSIQKRPGKAHPAVQTARKPEQVCILCIVSVALNSSLLRSGC